jgi:hypothetical protein
MNPGPYSNLQIVNATAQHLVTGSVPPPNTPAFNAYQMWAWFNWPGAPPVPIVPARTAMLYPVQALSGVGDEDDAANLLLNFNDPSNASANVLALYAGSDSDSAHYLQATPLSPNGSLVVAGVCAGSLLATASATSVQWFPTLNGFPVIAIGVFPNADQSLVVADLSVLFPQPQSIEIFDSIVTNSLSAADQQTLYNAVVPFASNAI